VVAHYGCAGNPVADEIQREQLIKSVYAIGELYPDMKVIGLWSDETWTVREVKNE
jgi:hypothetical protein